MSITYSTDQGVSMPRLRRRVAATCLRQVAQELGKELCEINYMFMLDEQLLSLNEQFLQHDYYTDCLLYTSDAADD